MARRVTTTAPETDRHRSGARGMPPMALLVFVVGAGSLGSPFLGGAVDALDQIAAGAFLGSLLAVTVLLAVPILMMGTIAPFAIRLSVGSVEESGQVAGRLYAISTLGSLAGVFLSALLLIPLVGTQRTFLAFALAMSVVAALALPPRWWLVPVALAAALAIPPGGIK